jgi:hypothetical protein
VGAFTGNLLGLKRRNGGGLVMRAPRETWRFIVHLDRIPPHILEDDAFRQVQGAAQEVECEIEAEDFAGAVAEAIRALEEDEFTHVRGIERISL